MEPIKVNTNHSSAVYALIRGLEHTHFYSGSGDRFVAQWNSETLEQMPFAIQLEQPVFALGIIPSRKMLAIGTSSGNIHLIDLLEKKEVKNLAVHLQSIYTFCFLEKENWLIAGSGDGTISIWNVADWQLIRRIPLGEFKIRSIVVSPDGYHVAIACGDGKIRILETMFFNEIYTLSGHEDGATSLAFHPQKQVLLSGGKDGFLRCWNMKNEYLEIVDVPAHYAAIYSIHFSPNAEYFITTSRDKSVKLWNAETLDFIEKIELSQGGHTHSINCALWTNDHQFVTGGDDRKMILVEV